MAEENDQGNRAQPGKLRYVSPRLTFLGTVHDITRATANMGSSDNGTGKTNNKTSV